jgi:hypothetical protein
MAVCWLSARTFSLLRRTFQKTDLAGERLQIGFLEVCSWFGDRITGNSEADEPLTVA